MEPLPALPASDGESLRADVARLREESERQLEELEWAYNELAQAEERKREEAQVAYAEVRDTVMRLERRVAELSTLNEIGRALGGTLRLDQVLEIIGTRLRSIIPGKLFGVAVVAPPGREVDLRVLAGEAAIVPGSREAMQAVVERITSTASPLRLPSASVTLPGDAADRVAAFAPCPAWIGVPLLAGDRVVGAVAVANDETYGTDGDDQRLLGSVAIQASIAVSNAHLYEDVVRRTAELGAVLEMSETLSSAWTESASLLGVLTRRTQELIPSDSFGIFLFDETRITLSPVVYEGPDREAVMRLRLPIGEGIIGLVARTGQPELVNYAHLDPRSKHVPGTEIRPECLLAVPLRSGDVTTGVLAVSREGDRIYRSSDLDFLTVVASHAAVALENARLFSNLEEALAENKRQQQQLLSTERLRTLGEMATGVAHDFNNILGAILGRAQLLLMRVDDEHTRKGLTVIEQAARYGADTVKRIQDFTRLSQPPVPERVDPNAAVTDVIEMTRPRWEAAAGGAVAVTSDLRSTHDVYANAAELREVLTNLVLNAVDACASGGRITVSTTACDSTVTIAVADTGCGMSAEVRERVFRPFFTTKGRKGNGLGLAISHGIVARYGGTLTVQSEPGAGSTFTIALPAHDLISESPAVPTPAAPANTETLCGSFIVVDDEREVAMVIAEFLRDAGHEVRVFLHAQEALDAYKEDGADAVFTDLGMPEVDGWDLTQALLQHDPHALIVIVSGWGLQLSRERMKAAGVFAVLAKPLSVERAQATAQDVLRAARCA